jgi:hypothetical protein
LTSFLRKLQDISMKRKKTAKRRKTGRVIDFNAGLIFLRSASQLLGFKRTPTTKVIKGTLKRGSTVTVEFKTKDMFRPAAPGKRTESGTVIGLTASQITLRVPSISLNHAGAGTQGTFLIDIHTPNDTITTPALSTLKAGSAATVESNEADWHQVPA